MKLTCPCCGYRTLSEECYGSYEVCSICDWEDDAVQLANPCSEGGANRMSLFDCQKAAESCAKEKVAAFERDPDWRPLNEEEVAKSLAAKSREHWSFVGETAPALVYWRKPKKIEPARLI
jgi:Cysteine-rich CPCC